MTAPGRPEQAVTGAGTGRIVWVDAVRGFAVAAVVLFHVVVWLLLGPVDGAVARPAVTLWDTVTSYLGSARMPVLLAVSGLVVARRVRSGGMAAVLQRSVETVYLYVVWLLVYAAAFAALRSPWLPHDITGPGDLLTQLVAPDTTLWYLLAIAVYPLLLAAVRSVHPAVVLTVLGAVAVVVPMLDWRGLWAKIPALAVYYAIGVYGAGQIRAIGDAARWWWLIPAAAAVVVVLAAGRVADGELAGAVLGLLRGVVFLVVLVIGVAVAVRWAPVGAAGSALGRRTLGVYVLHALLIDVIAVLAAGPLASWHERVVGSAPQALLYPVVVTVAVLLACLGLRRLLELAGLGVLFAMPRPWRDRLQRRVAAVAAPA